MKYNWIIWDFNGTLLNDVQASFNAANRLLSKHNLPQLENIDIYKQAFCFPIVEYYQKIGFDFSITPYDILAHEWVDFYNEEEKKCFLNPGISSLLDWINSQNVSQAILSASERVMLNDQLQRRKIDAFFKEIIGTQTIFAVGKEERAVMWKKFHPSDSVLYIGDTEQDAEIAKILDADCILFAGGHQTVKTLQNCKSLFITNDVEQIQKYLKSI